MSWVSRLQSMVNGPGIPIQNDTLFQSVGNALTTSNTTTLSGLSPTISKGLIRCKVYGGLSTPTLASLACFLSDGTDFVCVYNSGVWGTAISLSATPAGTQLCTDGAMSATGVKLLTSASNPFTAAMVGLTVAVSKAGNTAGSLPLYTTIASYVGPGSVNLSAATLETAAGTGMTVTLVEAYLNGGSVSAPAGVDFIIPFEIDINASRLDVVTTGGGTSYMDLEISGTT